MSYHKNINKVFIIMFFIIIIIGLTINIKISSGDEQQPPEEHTSFVPGDLVYFYEPTPRPIHMVIYGGKDVNGNDVFVEAMPPDGVRTTTWEKLSQKWMYYKFYYVKGTESYIVSDSVRQQAYDEAYAYTNHNPSCGYQYILRPEFGNWNPDDINPQDYIRPWSFLSKIVRKYCAPNFHCGEICWAGYMIATDEAVNIGLDSEITKYGTTGYDHTGPLWMIDYPEMDVEFTPDNFPPPDDSNEGIVDGTY